MNESEENDQINNKYMIKQEEQFRINYENNPTRRVTFTNNKKTDSIKG